VDQSVIADAGVQRFISSGKAQGRTICPLCSHERRKAGIPTLSLTRADGKLLYNCHHCGASNHKPIDLSPRTEPVRFKPQAKTIYVGKVLAQAHAEWFSKERGIGLDTLRHFKVFSRQMWLHGLKREAWCAGFPYPNGVKYRGIEHKGFIQDGICDTLWNIENVDPAQPIICTEGEADAMSAWQAGFKNVVSVPNGAPSKLSAEGTVDPKEDGKFRYVWSAHEQLNACPKIILAHDDDEPGRALGEELARRLGRAKCWRLRYPDGTKDLNDVLLKHGLDGVKAVIDAAEPWPVNGLYAASHYAEKVMDLYNKGFGRAERTGWNNVDELFRVAGGQIAIITGVPNSGKSQFVDALMVNLAIQSGWKSAICSFENPPAMHIPKLAELYVGRPFFKGPTQRMSEKELNMALAWVNEHFAFIDQQDGQVSTIDSILDKAKAAVQRLGARFLVIDPYNYIDRHMGDETETNFISDMLTKVRNFAQAHDVFVAFVAHPSKLQRIGKDIPVPKGYDIAASAAWFAKADIGITVHRPDPLKPVSEIHVWKVRWKWIGKQGQTELKYDVATGRYLEIYENAWDQPIGSGYAGDQQALDG